MTEVLIFQKKSVEVQAMQFTGGVDNASAISLWIRNHGRRCAYTESKLPSVSLDGLTFTPGLFEQFQIHTDKVMFALPGWWILLNEDMEFIPCSPDEFSTKYSQIAPAQYPEEA